MISNIGKRLILRYATRALKIMIRDMRDTRHGRFYFNARHENHKNYDTRHENLFFMRDTRILM
jgi:hypothetical protein